MRRKPSDVAALLKTLNYPRDEVIAALITECGLSREDAMKLYLAAPNPVK